MYGHANVNRSCATNVSRVFLWSTNDGAQNFSAVTSSTYWNMFVPPHQTTITFWGPMKNLIVLISEAAASVLEIPGIFERVCQSLHQCCEACIPTIILNSYFKYYTCKWGFHKNFVFLYVCYFPCLRLTAWRAAINSNEWLFQCPVPTLKVCTMNSGPPCISFILCFDCPLMYIFAK